MSEMIYTPLAALDRAAPLIAAGAHVFWNHSGGKDSDAGLERLRAVVPAAQLVVVHAALGDVEWPGALEHAERHARDLGLPFVVARARRTLLQMVEDRFRTRPGVPSWPSSGQPQCRSDLKRGPLAREIRRLAAARGAAVVLNAMGHRADESPRRAKQPPWRWSRSNSTRARAWYDWLPLHAVGTPEVFATIAAAGRAPHWAYRAGNQRLSCTFCIVGNRNDARVGAVQRPELFARYVELERRTGYTLHQDGEPLEAFAGISVAEARAAHRHLPVLRAEGA